MSSSQIGLEAFKEPFGFETAINDYHGLAMTVKKSHILRLKPNVIKYRSYKQFDAENFLSDVKLAKFDVVRDPELASDNPIYTFRKLDDKHAPLKRRCDAEIALLS